MTVILRWEGSSESTAVLPLCNLGAGGFILQVTFGGAGGNLVDVTERAEVESADAGQQ